MGRDWRLLDHGPASGVFNMAVDEVLLSIAAYERRGAVRFYTWEGAWLSLGYAQAFPETRRLACQRAGIGVVRRLTGGRAVLHGGDLTYAIAAPDDWLPAGLQGSYGLLSGALKTALQRLGVAAERTPSEAGAPAEGEFDCFAEAAADELQIEGRKLAGSAQRRAGGAVLQHGSVRISPDPAQLVRAAGLRVGASTSLEEEGCRVGQGALRNALAATLGEALGCPLIPTELGPDEIQQMQSRCLARDADPAIRPRFPSGIATPIAPFSG
ncbi:MAG: lipoate--protein ligase family protein [Myxococcota bacterium]